MAKANPSELLGNAKAEESKLAHFVQDLTGDRLSLVPFRNVGHNLPLDVLPDLDPNRLEVIADVDRLHSLSCAATSARPALLLYSRFWLSQNSCATRAIASASSPWSMPSPSSNQMRSSVATLPVAPGA